MYSTGRGTLSNLEARGSACTPSFAYVKLSPDCSVLGQCWTKHCSFTILTLNIHMEYKREYKRSGTSNPILGERNEASRKKKLQSTFTTKLQFIVDLQSI